jgi:hypothetical protein
MPSERLDWHVTGPAAGRGVAAALFDPCEVGSPH